MTQTYYVGLDVHKETISIAHALGGSREESTYHGQCSGSIAAVTKALSWRMQNRLYNRYVKLKARGKTETKIIVAIARELSGFIWELQTKLKLRDREQGQR